MPYLFRRGFGDANASFSSPTSIAFLAMIRNGTDTTVPSDWTWQGSYYADSQGNKWTGYNFPGNPNSDVANQALQNQRPLHYTAPSGITYGGLPPNYYQAPGVVGEALPAPTPVPPVAPPQIPSTTPAVAPTLPAPAPLPAGTSMLAPASTQPASATAPNTSLLSSIPTWGWIAAAAAAAYALSR